MPLTPTDPEYCNSVGSAPDGAGKSRICFNWNQAEDPEQLVDDLGPNRRIWWLPTLTDLTSYHWTVHQKIDPGTPATYCANQCGTINQFLPNSACNTGINNAVTNCQLLRLAIARHEASTVQNSHWKLYEATQNDPSLNFKAGAESIVGDQSWTLQSFQNKVNADIGAREFAVRTIAAAETMCAVCSDNCGEFWGHMNCRLGFPSGSWRWTCPPQ